MGKKKQNKYKIYHRMQQTKKEYELKRSQRLKLQVKWLLFELRKIIIFLQIKR